MWYCGNIMFDVDMTLGEQVTSRLIGFVKALTDAGVPPDELDVSRR